jgi:hypothetical protein
MILSIDKSATTTCGDPSVSCHLPRWSDLFNPVECRPPFHHIGVAPLTLTSRPGEHFVRPRDQRKPGAPPNSITIIPLRRHVTVKFWPRSTRGLAGGRLVGPRHQFGEYIGAERIGANDLLYVVAGPSNPARRSIGWQARNTFVPLDEARRPKVGRPSLWFISTISSA